MANLGSNYIVTVDLSQDNDGIFVTSTSLSTTQVAATSFLTGPKGADSTVPGPAGAAGVGVPTGGTANQVLAKIDSTNYNTQWVNQTGGGGGGGTWGSITGTLSNQTDLQSALNAKEPTLTAGTTAQYYRGDKSWQTLDRTAVGLSAVNNTSDASKPVSTATQTALNAKQDSLTLTTTGTSGASTLVGSTLNIPQYSGGGGGGTWGSITGTLSSQTDLQSALNAKEASVAAGTTAQYYRGDKTWQSLEDATVGFNGKVLVVNQPVLDALRATLSWRNEKPIKVLFAGSSTTAGFNASPQSYSYVNLITQSMQNTYPSGVTEFPLRESTTASWGPARPEPGIQSFGMGEGSATSGTYVSSTELPRIVTTNPDIMFHMIGANDFSGGTVPATYRTNIETVIDNINNAIATPCIHVLIHTYAKNLVSPAYPWTDYRDQLKAIAYARPTNVAFVDISEGYPVEGWPGADPFDIIDTDSTHQTNRGHYMMAESLRYVLGLTSPPTLTLPLKTGSFARLTSDNYSGTRDPLTGTNTDIGYGGTAKTWTETISGRMRASGGSMLGSNTGVVGASTMTVTNTNPIVEVSANVSSRPTSSSTWLLWARLTSPTIASADGIYAKMTGTTVQLAKRIAGTETLLGTSRALTAGDTITVRCSGTTSTLAINSKVTDTVTVADALTTAYAGWSITTSAGSIAVSWWTLDVGV